MTNQLKNNIAILNIFKNDEEFVEDFIRHHAPLASQVVMLNTGNEITYELAKKIAKEYSNVYVEFSPHEEVNFSKFRNDCLSVAKKQTEADYFIWIDTDERLDVVDEEELTADVIDIARADASGRFLTIIDRGFKSNLKGKWIKIIHEHFAVEDIHTRQISKGLKIEHLTSEAHRTKEKKQLYYSLLAKQFSEAEQSNYRQGKIDALQHLILMASHDFVKPELCIQLFETHKDLVYTAEINREISGVQKLNILIHAIMSYSRLQKSAPEDLIEEALKVDSSKSSYFQVMRALVFNPSNKPRIREMYERRFPKMKEPGHEFDNRDYLVEREVAWFEKKLYDRK